MLETGQSIRGKVSVTYDAAGPDADDRAGGIGHFARHLQVEHAYSSMVMT